MNDRKPIYAPQTVAKIAEKKADLVAAIVAGTMTKDEAITAYREFISLSIAHMKEHGPER